MSGIHLTCGFRSGAAQAHIKAWGSIDSASRPNSANSTDGNDSNGGAGDDRGSVALELVLLTPLVLVLVVFVAFCGRLTRAEAIVRDAAAAGARAASLRQQPSTARSDATAAVLSNLAGHTSTCPVPVVSVDTTSLRPGGRVSVEVRCVVPLRDLALLDVPGSRTVTARSAEVVDAWRGG
jgi:hypothetical protein